MGDYYDYDHDPIPNIRRGRSRGTRIRNLALFTLLLVLIALAGISFIENTILTFYAGTK